MMALELGGLLEVIENCFLSRSHHSIHYLYIHMMGKIKVEEEPDLRYSDAMMLKSLLKHPERNSHVEEICRKALEANVYPDIPQALLAEIEERVVEAAWPRSYPIKEQLQRAREAGYL